MIWTIALTAGIGALIGTMKISRFRLHQAVDASFVGEGTFLMRRIFYLRIGTDESGPDS